MAKLVQFRRLLKLLVVALAAVVLLDTAVGMYIYSDSRQWCNNHMLYKIPGRGRLTNNPYSTDELERIRLDCHASGLEQQLEYQFLPFNQAWTSRRLEATLAKCAAIDDYQFGWGCDAAAQSGG